MGLVAATSCTAPRADGYARRQPELTALHRTLRAHWPAFVEQAEQAGGLPRFVMREVQQYLHCGLLAHGCALLLCEGCGKSLLPGTDRARLERLCRYAARPPLAQERLTGLHDGRVRLELKKPWADGTTTFVMEPLDFIARLVAAIPPPRFHMVRFHGVLAPHSALRSLVVPKPQPLSELEAVIQIRRLDVLGAGSLREPQVALACRTRKPTQHEVLLHLVSVLAHPCSAGAPARGDSFAGAQASPMTTHANERCPVRGRSRSARPTRRLCACRAAALFKISSTKYQRPAARPHAPKKLRLQRTRA